MRKDYKGADIVCYLPFDTPTAARRFVKLARPEIAIFIKYEFWRNYIDVLHRNGIPTHHPFFCPKPPFRPAALAHRGERQRHRDGRHAF